MLMALEAVFAFSYLGYIELPAISTTTLHILVIVAAWSGTKVGTLSISSGCAFAGDHPDFSVRAAYPGSRSVHVCPETGILPGKETVLWHTRL